MLNVHFALRDGSFTYGGFYNGFGLSVSVYLLFAAFLAWHLGSLAARDPKAIGMLGWAFCAMELAQLAICATYFFLPPIVFTAVVALCLGAAAWRVRSIA